MKSILILISFVLCSLTIQAQVTYTTAADSDPEAKEILDQLRSDYENFESIEIDFKLEIIFPGDKPEFQAGSMIQKGNKFKFEMGPQALYCNGSEIWVHLKDLNEVQINDFEEADQSEFMSPKDVINMYETGEFAYAISNRNSDNSNTFTQIEFKPLNKDFEYSKIRLTLTDNNTTVHKLEVFSKDGSKYIMHVNTLESNGQIDDASFIFDKEKYPGISVEDLRL